jgi:hypothetical protein
VKWTNGAKQYLEPGLRVGFGTIGESKQHGQEVIR